MNEVWQALLKNKPLFLAVLAGVGIVLWIVYKSNPGNSAAQIGPEPGNIGATTTYPEGQIQIVNPAPVQILPVPTMGTNPAPVQVLASTSPQPPTYGLLGAGAKLYQQNGTWMYRLPTGQSGNLEHFLASAGYPGGVYRWGSQGRFWDIFRGKKYLVTSGQGPIVSNSGTEAG